MLSQLEYVERQVIDTDGSDWLFHVPKYEE